MVTAIQIISITCKIIVCSDGAGGEREQKRGTHQENRRLVWSERPQTAIAGGRNDNNFFCRWNCKL